MFGVGFTPGTSRCCRRSVYRSVVVSQADAERRSPRQHHRPEAEAEESEDGDLVLGRVSLAVGSLSDSVFDTSGLDRSQFGWLCGFTTPELATGVEVLVSLICWKSQRLHREASSSLLCETLASSKAVGALLWMVSFGTSLRITGFKHGDSLLLDKEPEAPTVLSRQAQSVVDPPSQGIVDAKSLFDALVSEQTQQDDRRAALEVGVIRDDLAALGMRLHWVPHDLNPTDALTKAGKGTFRSAYPPSREAGTELLQKQKSWRRGRLRRNYSATCRGLARIDLQRPRLPGHRL